MKKVSGSGQVGERISMPARMAGGGLCEVAASVVNKATAPRKRERHAAWFELYFHSLGEEFPRQIGRSEFPAPVASALGLAADLVCQPPEIVLSFKTDRPGTLYAVSYRTVRDQCQSARENLWGAITAAARGSR